MKNNLSKNELGIISEISPKLSVIIPCFNHGEFLEEAIKSVSEETDRKDIEIIVVNDGSTDSLTLQVLKKIENESVTVVHQENYGPASARNSGIQEAKGKYILPLDSDNKIRPGFLEFIIRTFDTNHEVDIIYSDAWFFGQKEGLWEMGEFDFPRLLFSNYIDSCAGFRKNVWEEIGGYDEKRILFGSEDWDFWMRAHLKDFSFFYINKIFFDYRVRNKSLVQVARENGTEIVNYLFEKPELRALKSLRERLIQLEKESNKIPEEPTIHYVLDIIKRKIKRKLRF